MKTLQDLVASLAVKPGIAKSWKNAQGEIHKESFSEYYQKIIDLSRGFMHLGIKPQDHVLYLADNNPDWIALSLALSNIGAVDVPRGTDFLKEELRYIAEHSDATFFIVKNERVFNTIKDYLPKQTKAIISLDNSVGVPLEQIRTAGNNSALAFPKVNEEDLSGIIYTSGTTGKPKGVMLTHKNFLANFPVLAQVEGMRADDVWMSVLPPWHVFQRAAEYCSLYAGAEMYHTEPAKVAQDLALVKPSILPSVPRVWESIYAKGMKKFDKVLQEKKGLGGIVFRLLTPWLIPNLVVPSAMGNAVKENLGGNMRFAVSGGGALPAHIDDFFRRAGVEIIEGYGMTETSPVIAARIHGEGKKSRYTVGYPLPQVHVRIADPDTNQPLLSRTYGEVQVSGDLVMKGYYKDEEATDHVFVFDDTGRKWFKTGDRGRFNMYGHLRLNGRYKETIIGSNGENIDPVSLENMLKKHELLENVMVFKPEGSKFLYALVAPNQVALEEYCLNNNIALADIKSLHQEPQIQEAYNAVLQQYNRSVKPQHQILGLSLLDSAFEVGKEITATLKLKRKEILENRRYDVNKLLDVKK